MILLRGIGKGGPLVTTGLGQGPGAEAAAATPASTFNTWDVQLVGRRKKKQRPDSLLLLLG